MSLIFATQGHKILNSVATVPVLCEASSEPGALWLLSGCWSGYRDRVWLGAGRDGPSVHLLGAAACDCRQVTFLLPLLYFPGL